MGSTPIKRALTAMATAWLADNKEEVLAMLKHNSPESVSLKLTWRRRRGEKMPDVRVKHVRQFATWHREKE